MPCTINLPRLSNQKCTTDLLSEGLVQEARAREQSWPGSSSIIEVFEVALIWFTY